jgi:hypothetical protein
MRLLVFAADWFRITLGKYAPHSDIGAVTHSSDAQ